jgi:circadian clock protein KaiC
VYLLQGDPGAGKTTLAMQFLLEGAERKETCLYITLSETREELEAAAASHGWSLENIHIAEMGLALTDVGDDENTLYAPAEIELGERMHDLLAVVDRIKPNRIVIDSSTELRLLAQTSLRFRRQILALKRDLIARSCTILLIENPLEPGGDPLLQSLVHGVIVLDQQRLAYGSDRRRIRVAKLREVEYRGGYHDVRIAREGIQVFPRLVAGEHHQEFPLQKVSCGIAELDELVGGGLDRGTATLVTGPAGSGKSAITTQYCVAAAARGERSAIFAFDEGIGTMLSRARSVGQPLEEQMAAGLVRLKQIDPAELSPGEFVHTVRAAVERDGAKIIVIDSLNGYLHSMPEEPYLGAQLHELLAYLRQRGVVVLIVLAQSGLTGTILASPIDVSYLADNVVLTRFFEARGRVRKALSVVKKRSGRHEDTIREFSLGPSGVFVSEPLAQFSGVLTGSPTTERRDHG